MLELVMLFLLSSVSFFVGNLERPTTFWDYKDAACPIVMGLLAAELIYQNVCVPFTGITLIHFTFYTEIERQKEDVVKDYFKYR